MTTSISRDGARVRLEMYPNGAARCTVAAFDLREPAQPCVRTDSFNPNRAKDRDEWVETLPEALREEAAMIAAEMGVEVERMRATVGAKRGPGDAGALFPAIEPWPDPLDGEELLDELVALIEQYVVLPAHGAVIIALWTAHTYVTDRSDFTPYLHLSSPVRGCGKSTVLDLLEHLAFRACRSDGITAAALYRRIDRLAPSMLMDEMDTRLQGESGELLRGVLNSGFHRGGRVTICVGDDHEERDFRTFCPKVLAGIGRLWDTVQSRSIAVRMQKASRAELRPLVKLRKDRIGAITEPARRKLTRWGTDTSPELLDADPEVPDDLEARQADVWRPLLAIADVAGGGWPRRARAAARALAGISEDEGDWALLLLGDVRVLFDQLVGTDKLPSARIAEELAKQEDRPWPEYKRDKPISTRQIAALLGRFGIKPKNVRMKDEERITKGYEYADCRAAFERYLPVAAEPAATSATPDSTGADVAAEPAFFSPPIPPFPAATSATRAPAASAVADVADRKADTGGKKHAPSATPAVRSGDARYLADEREGIQADA